MANENTTPSYDDNIDLDFLNIDFSFDDTENFIGGTTLPNKNGESCEGVNQNNGENFNNSVANKKNGENCGNKATNQNEFNNEVNYIDVVVPSVL